MATSDKSTLSVSFKKYGFLVLKVWLVEITFLGCQSFSTGFTGFQFLRFWFWRPIFLGPPSHDTRLGFVPKHITTMLTENRILLLWYDTNRNIIVLGKSIKNVKFSSSHDVFCKKTGLFWKSTLPQLLSCKIATS